MFRFIKSLQFILQPSDWVRGDEYSEPLDKEINRLLDDGVLFTNISDYLATLGHLKHLSIKDYDFCKMHNYVPSRLTAKRAKDVLKKSLIEESLQAAKKVKEGK